VSLWCQSSSWIFNTSIFILTQWICFTEETEAIRTGKLSTPFYARSKC
jgi:hypothetical protein